jgi:pimeloyl-ACP methyl ester carboxylesterase
MTSIDQWWDAGERVDVPVRGTDRRIFVRRTGQGPAMTLLHGFPSSSHDWAKVAPTLAERHSLLMPDFLGFGASGKPAEHEYSIPEQADLVEALWAREGIGATVLVAHDYGATVAQELLARRVEGALSVDLSAVHLLNGGLYPDLHRPEPAQMALLDPEQGPKLSAQMNAELIAMALRPTFADGYDHAADADAIWRSLTHGGGPPILHRLIRYIPDRQEHAERWTGALEATDVPLAFAWGMLDPISGAHMAKRIRERLPAAPFAALDDVGHWPPLEAPDRVTEAILSP